jgi:hypothetical protein
MSYSQVIDSYNRPLGYLSAFVCGLVTSHTFQEVDKGSSQAPYFIFASLCMVFQTYLFYFRN